MNKQTTQSYNTIWAKRANPPTRQHGPIIMMVYQQPQQNTQHSTCKPVTTYPSRLISTNQAVKTEQALTRCWRHIFCGVFLVFLYSIFGREALCSLYVIWSYDSMMNQPHCVCIEQMGAPKYEWWINEWMNKTRNYVFNEKGDLNTVLNIKPTWLLNESFFDYNVKQKRYSSITVLSDVFSVLFVHTLLACQFVSRT